MAFGLAPAPRVFTELLKVVSTLGDMAFAWSYIIFLNATPEGLKCDVQFAVDLLRALSFLINWDKSDVVPKQFMEYLGFVVDSVHLSLSLPDDRVSSVISMCRAALDADLVSLRVIASILGNFNWAIPSVPFAHAHYRSMQHFYISESRKAHGNLNDKRSLSDESRKDLTWRIDNLATVDGRLFFPKKADLEIFSDASLSGWGAVCNGVISRGPWTLHDSSRHINELELLGALFALKSFVGTSRDISVRLFLYNFVAVCYINKCGGTKLHRLTKLAKLFSLFCKE